jgi:uncharacterized protein (TIGR02646 family)
MRKINKETEPSTLTIWKRKHPQSQYADLTATIRQAIRKQCIEEQFCLCAYCCALIKNNPISCHNEHLDAQDKAPQKTLDYDNMVASCNANNQCGKAHKSQPLSLTPLMNACETELKFYLTGRVTGLTPRADKAIIVLNLNHPALVETRKQLVDALIYEIGEDPKDIEVLDDYLLEVLLEDMYLSGKEYLRPFSPVLVNMIKGWLSV